MCRRCAVATTREFATLWCVYAPIDLNQLRAFVAVLGRGNFSTAAQELGVPRSTVSRAIAALETALGVRLFQRTTRAVQPTAAALALAERVTPSLQSLDVALRELPQADEVPSGQLRVTTTADLGTVVLAEVVSRFCARYPRVQVEAHLDNEIVDLVRDGFDLALRLTPGRLRSSSLLARKVGDLAVQLYAAPSYLARRGTPRRPSDLAKHDWVWFGGTRPLESIVRRRDLRGVPARVVCRDPFFAREVLRTGGGVGVLPTFLADADVAAGALVRLLPRWVAHTGAIYVVQPPGAHRPRRATAFVELLLEMLRQRPIGA